MKLSVIIFIIFALITIGAIFFYVSNSSYLQGELNYYSNERGVRRDLNIVKLHFHRYHSTYKKYPTSFNDLLEESLHNTRGIKFYDGNEIPKDIYTDNQEFHIIRNVSEVVKRDNDIKSYKVEKESKNMIVYSIGENGKDDKGIYDQTKDKDDIALFLCFE